MQVHHAAIALCGLVLISAAIVVTGAPLTAPAVQFDADAVAEIDRELGAVPAEPRAAQETEPVETLAVPEQPPSAPEEAAAAPDPQAEPERIEPRAPLSELSSPQQPKPPKTKMPDEWRSTRLFNPVAQAAGMV
jgi:hypothetical protein